MLADSFCSSVMMVAVVVLIAPSAFPQILDKPAAPAATNRVRAVPVSALHLRAGGNAKVELPFEVARGFHINSHQPNSDLLVATVVTLHPPTDIGIAKIAYPPGHDLSFAFAPEEKLSVYTGDFTVSALVAAARTTPPGRYRVHGTLKYQACDDKACYPPGQVPVAFDVQIAPALRSGRPRRNPPQSPHIHQ